MPPRVAGQAGRFIGIALMVPVLVLAGYLRTRHLAKIGVQIDESFLQRMVEFPWGEMFERIGRDTHPPLFHVVFRLWGGIFGDSVAAGRWLTALCGILSVAGVFAFVRRAYWRSDGSTKDNFVGAELPAVVTATMLAVAPLHLYWDLQIRMYSLAVALTVWSSYLLVSALYPLDSDASSEGRSEIGRWWAYTVSAVLLAYTHYFGLFVLIAHYLYALGYRWRFGKGSLIDRLAPILISGCGLAFACQPWLLFFLEQRDAVSRNFYLPQPSWTVLGNTMHELWAGGVAIPVSSTTGLLISQAAFLAMLLLAVGRRRADYLIILSVAIPVLLAYAISKRSHSLINARYFLLSHTFLMAGFAVVACRVPSFGRYVAIGALLWPMGTIGHAQYQWREQAATLPGMQAAISRIDVSRGKEPLLVCNPMLYTSVLTYITDREGVSLFGTPGSFPFFQGTAVIRNEEYCDSGCVNGAGASHVWTLDADESMGRVALPAGWNLVQEERYAEWYVSLIVRLYVRAGDG